MAFWIKSTGGEEKEKSLLVVAANAHLKQLEINVVNEGAAGEGLTVDRKWAWTDAGRIEGSGVEGAVAGGADDVGEWQPGDQNLSRLVQAAAQKEGQLCHLILW